MSFTDGGASEYIGAVTRATPSAAGGVAVAVGLDLNDWVLIATLVYTLAQFAFLIYDRFIKRK